MTRGQITYDSTDLSKYIKKEAPISNEDYDLQFQKPILIRNQHMNISSCLDNFQSIVTELRKRKLILSNEQSNKDNYDDISSIISYINYSCNHKQFFIAFEYLVQSLYTTIKEYIQSDNSVDNNIDNSVNINIACLYYIVLQGQIIYDKVKKDPSLYGKYLKEYNPIYYQRLYPMINNNHIFIPH